MPRGQELPDALTGLAHRNALNLRHESFRADADRLLAAIEPILRPAASTQLRTFEHPSKWGRGLAGSKKVYCVAFSPDGRWLATGSDDDTARIWDAHSGEELHTLKHESSVWAVVFSPDGRWLATCGMGDTALIWDANSGQPWHTFRHHYEDMVTAVAFSPDGRWLATGGEDRTLRIWDADSGQQAHVINHDHRVWAVAFSPDGRWLATGTGGNRAVLWMLTPASYQ